MKKSIEKQIQKDYDEVQKWPKWKQRIIISARAAETGQFYNEEMK